jgi:hypothetical protein
MMRVCFALALVCLLPDRVVAQTPVDGWSGQVQCQIASRGVGYEDDQTHTWVLSGAPGVRNDFRDYPATWTVSGTGRRTPGSARVSALGVGEAWTYGGSNAGASITLFVPVGTGTIRIASGQRPVTATNGIKGTAATAAFAANVAEWRFQYIDVVNGAAQTTLSDSRTQSRNDLAGWRPPPGTTVTETCSWKLTKSGASTAGGANAKGATAAAGAGTAGAGTARGAVIPEGAAPAGGAASAAAAAASNAAASAAGSSVAGAASAGAPSPSPSTTKPAGGATSAAAGAAAAAASGAAANPTTAGNSSSALSPDVMRPYTAIGRTPTPGTGVVVATLVDDTGAPLIGVSIADIRLLDARSLPVGMGPYMFGTTGDIVDSSTLRASASFNGRSRVAFLDVPAGTLTLTIMYSRDGKVVTRSAKVITKAGAITAVQP